MTLPVLDLDRSDPHAVLDALQVHGAFHVRDGAVPEARFARARHDAAWFFDRPQPVKDACGIDGSVHFRGYSLMHNERDWREQIHLGRDLPPIVSDEPHWRLQGPNRWPDDAAWRARMLEWLSETARVGERVLDHVAAAIGTTSSAWLGESPYLLLKLIGYHPQSSVDEHRRGVAAHLDFSLVTLTAQDDVGGLRVQRPDGLWLDVAPRNDAWLVHAGELLQYVTGDRVVATPHEVRNPSLQRRRVSMPVFVCPALDATVHPMPPGGAPRVPFAGPHVHAVLDPANPPPSIAFGPAEWHRKGENIWCTTCCA
jgi:isopenicillin N synthase-like dioxygenase